MDVELPHNQENSRRVLPERPATVSDQNPVPENRGEQRLASKKDTEEELACSKTPLSPMEIQRNLEASLTEEIELLERWKEGSNLTEEVASELEKIREATNTWRSPNRETDEQSAKLLQEQLDKVSEFILLTAKETDHFLDSLDEIEHKLMRQVNDEGLCTLLEAEYQAEEVIEKALGRIALGNEVMNSLIIPAAKDLYSSRTGFLDGKRTAGALPYGASIAGLAGTGYLTLSTVHPELHHIAHEFYHGFHNSILYAAAFVGTIIPVALADFIVFSSGGTAASFLTGMIRTRTSRIMRAVSPKAKERYDHLQTQADDTQERLRKNVKAISDVLTSFNEELIEHYQRNDILRAEASRRVSNRVHPDNECHIDCDSTAKLKKLTKELGKPESLHKIMGNIHEKAAHLTCPVDVRSRELQRTSQRNAPNKEEELKDQSESSHMIASSDENGSRLATRIAESFHDKLETFTGENLHWSLRGPAKFAASFAATFCSMHAMMIQTATDPFGTTLETFASGAKAVDFGSDQKDGIGLIQIGGKAIAIDDLKSGKTWKWAGKFIPNMGLFVFKKVYFIMQAQKDELKKGKISRSMLKKEFIKSKGVVNQWSDETKGVSKVLLSATGGMLTKRLIETPLRLAASIERQFFVARYLGETTGFSPTKLLDSWFNLRSLAVKHGPLGLPSIRQLLPEDTKETLEKRGMSMSEDEFQIFMLKKLNDYQADRKGTTAKGIGALFKFWESRDELRWLESQQRMAKHQLYLAKMDPRLSEMPIAVKTSSGFIGRHIGKLIPEVKPDSRWITRKLNEALTLLRPIVRPEERVRQLRLETFKDRANTVVLDVSSKDKLVMLQRNGTIWMRDHWKTEGILRRWAKEIAHDWRRTPIVAPYADEARIAVIESVLGGMLDDGSGQPARILRAHKEATEIQTRLKGEEGVLEREKFLNLMRFLARGSFTITQLFGEESQAAIRDEFVGLIPAGLIGNKKFPKPWIKKARKILIREGYPL